MNQVIVDLEKKLGIDHGICGAEKLTTETRLILIVQEQQVKLDDLERRLHMLEPEEED